ncbi:MAG: metallophosphoesterase [Sulfolobales archaeon]
MHVLRFLAFGDVHVPRYFPVFVSSVNSLVGFRPDIILLAGDIVDRGDVRGFDLVRRFLRSKYGSTPIVSVFGNEEYTEMHDEFRKRYSDIIWLDDSSWYHDINGVRLCVFGSRGSLEKLTPWQSRSAPHLRDVYEWRIENAKSILSSLRASCYYLILLLHYAPTYLTLRGEPESIYKFLGHRGFERVIMETRPDLVLHAHSHGSRVLRARIGASNIFNVSIPAVGSVTAGIIRKNLEESDPDIEIISPTGRSL